MPVDMVLLQLHGAMIAEGYEDAEGDLRAGARDYRTQDLRRRARSALPSVGAEGRDARSVDGLQGISHTDIYLRAKDLVRLSESAVTGKTRPVMRVRDLGFVSLIHTSREPARSLVDRLLEMGQGRRPVDLARSWIPVG